jgi:hypothetical protein
MRAAKIKEIGQSIVRFLSFDFYIIVDPEAFGSCHRSRSSQSSSLNTTERIALLVTDYFPFRTLVMNSDSMKHMADTSERDAVWESETPFSGQRQDSTTSNRGILQSLASPVKTSANWRRPTSEPLNNSSSAANPALSSNHYNYGARPPRFTSRLNPTGQQAHPALNPRQKRAQPGTAAAARRLVSNSYQKPASAYMKQSCLPVDERDPVLELAEQHTGRLLAKEAYRPGMMIRAPIHEPFLPGAADIHHRAKTYSLYGPVFTKVRKMIVVAVYYSHYTALPLYTHNGNGLQGKSVPDEFVSLKDHRSQAPFTPLSKHSALTTETMVPGVNPMSPMATVHLTYPVSRQYDIPSTPEGQLDEASTKTLIGLYRDSILRS